MHAKLRSPNGRGTALRGAAVITAALLAFSLATPNASAAPTNPVPVAAPDSDTVADQLDKIEGANLIAGDAEAAEKAAAYAPYNQRKAQQAGTDRRAYFVELKTASAGVSFTKARAGGASVASAQEKATATADTITKTSDTVLRRATKIDSGAKRLYSTKNVVAGFAATMNSKAANGLAESADVVSVKAIVPKTIDNASSDEFTGVLQQWQDTGALGDDVSIGIIDTGIDYTHADFGGPGTAEAFEAAKDAEFVPTDKVVGGHDFVGDDYNADPTSPTYQPVPHPDGNPLDCNGHGSHVAGTAAGLGVNADGTPFTGDYPTLDSAALRAMKIGPGTAPKADLYGLRVFGCDGSTDAVIAALDWALDPDGDHDYTDHLDVINLSLGSSFASADDPENHVLDRMASLGVLAVIASGNDGDITMIGGSPGNATSALTVANSVSNRLPYDGITVNAPSGVAGPQPGQYSIAYTGTEPITGDVVKISDANPEGCTAYSEADAMAVSGKVVWVTWPEDFACGSAARADNATAAGAIGIVLSSDVDAFSAGLSGNDSIPMFQFNKTATAAVRPALDAGELNVSFDFQTAALVEDVPGAADTLNPGSSRGVYGALTTVKPDVAAPGTQIMSALVGGGSDGQLLSGTSMATPHTAGIAATVKSEHQSWTPEQVKAAVMNTAVHDVNSLENGAGENYGPNRVGSGRVDAAYAATNSVLAYNADGLGGVSASFGVVEVPIDGPVVTQTREVTVENTGDAAVTAAVSYAESTQQPGVSYSIAPSSVTVPAGGTATVTITMTADPATLGRQIDPTMSEEQSGITRQYVTLASGRLLVDTGAGDPLRVPVSTAAKPVSTTTAVFDTTDSSVVLNGTGMDDDSYISQVDVFALGGSSPQKPDCTATVTTGCTQGPRDAGGDLRWIGATSDYVSFPDDELAWAVFGVNSWSNWTVPGLDTVPYVDIWTVSDPDTDAPDFELFVAPYFLFGLEVEYSAAVLVDVATGAIIYDMPVNMVEGDVDSNIYDTDTLKMAVPLAALYAGAEDVPGNPPESLDAMSYNAGTYSVFGYGADDPIDQIPADGSTIPFDPRNPDIYADQGVIWVDEGDTYLPVSRAEDSDVDKMLVLHQHGPSGQRADVLTYGNSSGNFSQEIQWMLDNGIATGYDDGFRPTTPVSRQAMAAFLYRFGNSGADAPACTSKPFPDVEVNNQFCGEIAWFKDQGISTGYEDGTYRPTAGVSRQAMSAFLNRLYLGGPSEATCVAVSGFPDVPRDNEFCGQVRWMTAETGLASGYSDGTFRPTTPVSRQAMSSFLYRYNSLLKP